jgi:hypothetical protein
MDPARRPGPPAALRFIPLGQADADGSPPIELPDEHPPLRCPGAPIALPRHRLRQAGTPPRSPPTGALPSRDGAHHRPLVAPLLDARICLPRPTRRARGRPFAVRH